MAKARLAADAHRLLDIPNVGPATVGDLNRLGIVEPVQLRGRDPFALYRDLCRIDGIRHDPCVADVLIAAVRFMEGEAAQPWWAYTPTRKSAVAAQPDLLG